MAKLARRTIVHDPETGQSTRLDAGAVIPDDELAELQAEGHLTNPRLFESKEEETTSDEKSSDLPDPKAVGTGPLESRDLKQLKALAAYHGVTVPNKVSIEELVALLQASGISEFDE